MAAFPDTLLTGAIPVAESRIITVFRMYAAKASFEEFERLYGEMSGIVSAMPGYVAHKVFVAEDGERVVVAEWSDKDAFLAWDRHPEHKKAKELGKAYLFDSYDVAVAEIFERHAKP